MSKPERSPYGAWQSPVTSDLIVAESIRLISPEFDADDIYWLEQRPTEEGRLALVRRTPDGQTSAVTPQPFNVRTRVHEYGGHAYTVADGVVYFSHFADQRLYRQAPDSQAHPITPATALRYADYVVDRRRDLLFCVREDHTGAGEAVNTLVKVRCGGDTNGGEVIVAGNDFYSSPRLSPDGARLAWLTWNHPNMPWDGTELWVGDLDADGAIVRATCVAGGPAESIFQPEWSPDGLLYFISDRTGWWNLYRQQDGRTEALCPLAAEFGQPQWAFGMSTYAFVSSQRIICTYTQQGVSHLASLDTVTLALEEIATPYTNLNSVRVGKGGVLFIGGSATESKSLCLLDLDTQRIEVLQRESTVQRRSPLHVNAARHRVPNRGRPDSVRLLLSAPQSGLQRASRREATPAGEEPRWANRRHNFCLRSRGAVLDQPGNRSPGRKLRRQHRLWPGLPAAAQRPVGHRGCGRLRKRRALSGRVRARWTASG